MIEADGFPSPSVRRSAWSHHFHAFTHMEIGNRSPLKPTYPSYATIMAKLISIFAAAIAVSTPGSHAFIAPGSVRATDVRLFAKLEGREIEGVLTPTNNFVLVKVAAIQDQTEGGIILTGSVRIISSAVKACSICNASLTTDVAKTLC
jgi:hypothetical protein